MSKDKPFLCKCRNDKEGAMTLKRISDDFHGCPRCGGLLVIGIKANKRKFCDNKLKLRQLRPSKKLAKEICSHFTAPMRLPPKKQCPADEEDLIDIGYNQALEDVRKLNGLSGEKNEEN